MVHSMHCLRIGVLLGAAALASPSAGQEFIRLGTLDGAQHSGAVGVSADGRTVIGNSGGRGFTWTRQTGVVPLGEPGVFSDVWGISADGKVIVGATAEGAARWTPNGVEQLGTLVPGGASIATAASGDGSYIVGASENSDWGYQGFIWHNGTMSPLDLGPFAVGGVAETMSVSNNGTRAAGYAEDWNRAEAMLWDHGTPIGLGYLPSGGGFSTATVISGDGRVIGGQSDVAGGEGWRAVRWTVDATTNSSTIEEIPSWLPHEYQVNAITASNVDGSVLGGYVGAQGVLKTAFIWDEVNGTRELKPLLEGEYGFDLTGWRLTNIEDISDNGNVIVGYGINPQGFNEGFIFIIPAPGAASLLAVAGLIGARRRRA